jgi:hypothetical protein
MKRNQAVRLACAVPRVWGAISSLATINLYASAPVTRRNVADSMAAYTPFGHRAIAASQAGGSKSCTRPTRSP